MKKESQIQKEIIQYLRTIPNLYFFKVISANYRGVPDIIICYEGRFIGMEVKTQRGRISGLQKYHCEQIKKADGICFVVRSLEDVKKIIKKEIK